MILQAGTTVRIKGLHRQVDEELAARYRDSIGRIGKVAAAARGLSGREIVGVILPEDTLSGDFLLFYRDEVEPITSELTAAGVGSASTTEAALSA